MQAPTRLLSNQWLIGITLTLLVTFAWTLGLFNSFEYWLYDQRAAQCQYFLKPPSDRILYLDIDDSVLRAISVDEQTSWPWPRQVLAEMIDEIGRAAPAAIALDIILSEPQRLELRDNGDGTTKNIDHDALLIQAIRQTHSTLVPVSVHFDRQPSEGLGHQSEIAAALHAHPDADDREIIKQIEDATPGISSQQLLDIRTELPEARARLALRRLLIPSSDAPTASGHINLLPMAGLIDASAMTGFVDYPSQNDARLRNVPLLVQTSDGVVPQMGLALACKLLDVDPKSIQWDENKLQVGDITIPVSRQYIRNLDDSLPAIYPIPWFGPADWRDMYREKSDGHQRTFRHHLSLTEVWNICRSRRLILSNNARADEALAAITSITGMPANAATQPTDPEDILSRSVLFNAIMLDSSDMVEMVRSTPPDQMDDLSRAFLKAVDDLPKLLNENRQHAILIDQMRATLKTQLAGKGILVGWVASGAVADIKPTSLHDALPGVIAHGVVANSILTGEMWRVLPNWVAILSMLLAGLIATPIGAKLSPGWGVAVVTAIIALWLGFNGLLLFDKYNLLLPAGGPLLVCVFVFAVGTIARLMLERIERRRIRVRFSNYVDPQLVAYVEANPTLNTFEGQVREMTVVFNDIANFTPLTRKLGQRTIPLLNEFFGDMVPVIRANNGYVNKFLGDGIMFFYGAPQQNPNHASDAVASILDLQKQLQRFNERLASQDLPAIGLRAGVSTGEMVVGDAGGRGASDYTVLGDAVNLGARLESANKALDSQSLITASTVAMTGNQYLYRPMGRLVVVGRDIPVECYEVLSRATDATPDQHQHVELSRAIVEYFQAGQFTQAITAIDRYIAARADNKFTRLYRNRSEYHRNHPNEPFDGSIILADK